MTALVLASRPAANGFFELKLRLPWYGSPGVGLDALHYDLAIALRWLGNDETTDLKDLSPNEVVGLLDNVFGADWLTQVAPDASSATVQATKQRFERSARWQLVKSGALGATFWGCAVVLLIGLVHSTHLYFFRLYGESSPRRWPLLRPVATQISVAAIGVASIFVMRMEFWPASLLVPAVVATLLAEAWATFRKVARA